MRAAQATDRCAIARRGLVLITHEHIDHQGGLVALDDPAALARAAVQSGASCPATAGPTCCLGRTSPCPAATIAGTQPQAVAPGVVVIPAPSHTPGSQMIFVRLADGREFLFAGDIATWPKAGSKRAPARGCSAISSPRKTAPKCSPGCARSRPGTARLRRCKSIPGHDLRLDHVRPCKARRPNRFCPVTKCVQQLWFMPLAKRTRARLRRAG